MYLEILSLSVPSFPEHLYVFVVLMNGTKVSGGPAWGGSSLWGKTVVVSLKWTLLSGQLLWGWQWENSRQREWWRLDPATSPLQPLSFEMIDGCPFFCTSEAFAPSRPPRSHACSLHMYKYTYAHKWHMEILMKTQSFFSSVPVVRDSNFSASDWLKPFSFTSRTCHKHIYRHAHSLSLPLRPLPSGSRYGFVKS